MSDVCTGVLLNGGLYQRMLLHCQFLRLLALAGSYCRAKWYPLSSSAWSKDALSDLVMTAVC